MALSSRLFYFEIEINTIQTSTTMPSVSPFLFTFSTYTMTDSKNDATTNNEIIKINRALTYTEMMNEGRQSMTSGNQEQGNGLQERGRDLNKCRTPSEPDPTPSSP